MRKSTGFGVTLVLLAITVGATGQESKGSKLFPDIFDDSWTPPTRTDQNPVVATTKPVEATPKPAAKSAPLESPPETPAPAPLIAPASQARDAAKRLEVPSADQQGGSRKLMREIFAGQLADKSHAGRRKLVQTLRAEADKVRDNPVDRYVLLTAMVHAGREAGSLPDIIAAADELSTGYKVDGLAIKGQAAGQMSFKAETGAATARNVEVGLSLANDLVSSAEFASAGKVLQALLAAADPAEKTAIAQRAREVAYLTLTQERARQAALTLKGAPDDPAALYAVGSYLSFVKQDWEAGLPMLARCNVPQIKAAALADLTARASGGLEQAADGWWSAGEKDPNWRTPMCRRAVALYTELLASGKLTGLARTRVEKRVAEIGAPAVTPSAPALAVAVADPKSNAPAPAAARRSGVLVIRSAGNLAEEHQFKALFGENVRIFQNRKSAFNLLGDPKQIDGLSIIAFGTNQWRDSEPSQLSEAFLQSLRKFVANGGDLVLYHQWDAVKMPLVQQLFGVETIGGGAKGGEVVDAPLKSAVAALGLAGDALEDMRFYNRYTNLPEQTRIFVRSAKDANPVAVLIPFGTGRILMLGAGGNTESAEVKLNEAILGAVYRKDKP